MYDTKCGRRHIEIDHGKFTLITSFLVCSYINKKTEKAHVWMHKMSGWLVIC